MSVDLFGTSWDQRRSMVQYSFTSTETRRLVRTDTPGRPPRLSHSSWIMMTRRFLLICCFTSTEARWLIRDGDRVGRGRKSEGSTAETARKRPERPWIAARTMYAIAVSTAVLGQSHKDNVRCTAVDEQLGQFKQRKSNFLSPAPPPYSWSLLG